jgi:Amidase
MTAPNHLSAAEAVAQLGSGALTAEALTRACLDRAEERRDVKAWIWLDPEQALAQGRAADRAGRPGLLAGLPIGVKDIIETVDMPTEHARRSIAAIARLPMPPASRFCAWRAARSWARPSPPNSPTGFRARRSTRTTRHTPPAARRAARPPRSPISRCRPRSGPKPVARTFVCRSIERLFWAAARCWAERAL